MNFVAQDLRTHEKRWFQKKPIWILAAILVCVMSSGVATFVYLGLDKIPDVAGSLTIEGDPETRIYIGDKLIGTTKVSVSWPQLLGDRKTNPLAMELPYPSGIVTPELISGPGAKVLESRNLSRGHTPDRNDSEDSYIMRRADGTLDHVVAYLIEFTSASPPRRYLILLRARQGTAGSAVSFEHRGGRESCSSVPGSVKAFGKSPTEMEYIWELAPYTPHNKFTTEVEKRGFWEPGFHQDSE